MFFEWPTNDDRDRDGGSKDELKGKHIALAPIVTTTTKAGEGEAVSLEHNTAESH